MELIDTHAHLTATGLVDRLDEVLENARKSHVAHIITIAADADDSQRCVELAREHAIVSASAGIHPHEAGKFSSGDADRVAALADEPEVVAIGEMGLDYHYDFADRDTQLRVFSAQLELAQGRGLPLVIHCREAFDDCIAALERYGFRDQPVVFHCFTGSASEAERVARCGWRISFTGVVTFKNSTALREIARVYPADKLMVETDSPYLSPVPVRNIRPNQPAHILHTVRFLAELREVEVETLAQSSAAAARSFFRLEAT